MSDLRDRLLDGSTSAGPPPFRCLRTNGGGTVSVTVAGELDVATAPLLDRALRSAWASTSADVVRLDLRRLEFIDSTGAQLLLDADRRIRNAGGRLIIVRGPAALVGC